MISDLEQHLRLLALTLAMAPDRDAAFLRMVRAGISSETRSFAPAAEALERAGLALCDQVGFVAAGFALSEAAEHLAKL